MHIEPPTEPHSPGGTRFIRARGGALIAALAGAALLSACGSSSSTSGTSGSAPTTDLNTARISKSIEESILKERHIHAKVSCPAVVPQETGKTFTCIATSTSTTSKGGKTSTATVTTPFTVTVQNSRGYVTYHS
jgi:hypothetical protein